MASPGIGAKTTCKPWIKINTKGAAEPKEISQVRIFSLLLKKLYQSDHPWIDIWPKYGNKESGKGNQKDNGHDHGKPDIISLAGNMRQV